MNFKKYIDNAKSSSFGLWKLNMGLFYMIPFNKPHGIKVQKLEDNKIITSIPLKRKNLNHIKGIHACALATCAEFASGLLLLTKLEAKDYRIIMQSLTAEYLYQAKTAVTAEYELTDDWVEKSIKNPLKDQESVMVKCEIKLFDAARNQVAMVHTNWQIKSWSQVKTRL